MAAIAAEKIASSANRPNSVYAVSIAAPVPGNKAFVADMKNKVQPQGGLRIENPYDLVFGQLSNSILGVLNWCTHLMRRS